MKILLIGMKFYNYEIMIKEEMEAQGHVVDLINDVPDNYTVVNKLCNQKITRSYIEKYQKNLLKQNDRNNYDLILVIVGRFLTEDFLKELKKRNEAARFVLYLWDDVARVDNFEEVKSYYDTIFSFDPVDCKNRGFKFLPLFYTNEFTPDNRDKQYDIYSAVSEHSDRVSIIKQVISQNKNRNLLFIVNMGKYGYARKKISDMWNKQKGISEIKYVPRPIDKQKNIEYMRSSKAILDIQFSTQKGLTIRTVESLACKTKLITTNPTVKLYDFYHPNNIYILKRENPQIDWKFLDLPYYNIAQEIYDKYSMGNWVKTILAEKENNFWGRGKTIADL